MKTPTTFQRTIAAITLAVLALAGCAGAGASTEGEEHPEWSLDLSAAVSTAVTAATEKQEQLRAVPKTRLAVEEAALHSLDLYRAEEAKRAQEEAERLAAEERARQEAEERARREAQQAQEAKEAAEEKARVTDLQEALVDMGYSVQVDGVLGEHTQAALGQLARDSGTTIATGKPDKNTLAAVQRLKEEGHRSPPPSFTTNVWTTGHQAEVDQCRGAVVIDYFQRITHYGEDGTAYINPEQPAVPVIGQHNHCGARPSLDVPIGGTITFTGLHAGTYELVDEMTVYPGQRMDVVNDLRGEVFFATCYTSSPTGPMRMVGMKKVD